MLLLISSPLRVRENKTLYYTGLRPKQTDNRRNEEGLGDTLSFENRLWVNPRAILALPKCQPKKTKKPLASMGNGSKVKHNPNGAGDE